MLTYICRLSSLAAGLMSSGGIFPAVCAAWFLALVGIMPPLVLELSGGKILI
jgi:hypothetical protein